MRKAYFYVGSNNHTGKLEQSKIISVLQTHFEGLTAFVGIGVWQGKREGSLKVEVITERSDTELATIARELAQKLQQDVVLLEIVESNFAFVQAVPPVPKEEKPLSMLELAASLCKPLGG